MVGAIERYSTADTADYIEHAAQEMVLLAIAVRTCTVSVARRDEWRLASTTLRLSLKLGLHSLERQGQPPRARQTCEDTYE